MSLVPYDFYEEMLKMAKQPRLHEIHKELIEELAKNVEAKRVVMPSRKTGKTHMTLAQALSQLENKKKEKKCFVFR